MGLPKGAQGRGNAVQHMLVRCVAGQRVSRGEAKGKEEAMEETERERKCKVDSMKLKLPGPEDQTIVSENWERSKAEVEECDEIIRD